MTSTQLLDINVDTLFEQHGIGDIDQIHRRLQNNVEEKREELRMMVGLVFNAFSVFKNKKKQYTK